MCTPCFVRGQELLKCLCRRRGTPLLGSCDDGDMVQSYAPLVIPISFKLRLLWNCVVRLGEEPDVLQT